MLLLPCPWCGDRNATEFQYVGEVARRPDPNGAQPAQWRAYLHLQSNPCGWTTERWYHRAGCRQYFTIERHTYTHERRSRATAGGDHP